MTITRQAREEIQNLYRAIARIMKMLYAVIRRHLANSTSNVKIVNTPVTEVGTSMEVSDYQEMKALFDRVRSGDRAAEDELCEFFAQHPDIYSVVGSFTDHLEELLLRVVMRESGAGRVATQIGLDQWRIDLNREKASPLERLLIDQVRCSYIDVSIAPFASTNARDTRTEVLFWQRQIDRAQKRLLSAVDALAELRERIRSCQ